MPKAAISIVKESHQPRLSRNQATILARKLVKSGKTYDQISKTLAKKGFVGPRTGKPLSGSSLSAMVGGRDQKN